MILSDYLSKTVNNIPASAIRRFFDMASEMKGEVISLSIGEPDFVTPWSIREAGIYSLEKGQTHYSPNAGYMELREAICHYHKQRFAQDYSAASQVVVTVGGSEAIDLLVRAVINPGDEVIIPEPCFVAYQACVKLAGGVPVPVDCQARDGFKLQPDQLEAAISKKTKLVMLGYPNNPTGAVLTEQEVRALAAVLEDKDILIMSDELYAELTYAPQQHFSLAQIPEFKERTVVINGFSKAFAMTGWRIGYALGPKTLIAAMNKIHQYAIMSSPTTAQMAAVEALKDTESHVSIMREEYDKRRRLVVKACREAGLPCHEPAGAFYVFPDISQCKMSSNTFCERFLQEEKVAIVPGNAFGKSGEGFVRISYAAALSNIKEAMSRLDRFVQRSRSNA